MVARIALLRFGLVVALAFAACDQLPLLAPSGSTVTLTSSHIVLGVSETAELTAHIVESGGTPVHNGTLVWKTGAAIRHPDSGLRVLFQVVPESKTVKNRVHLDVRVPERRIPEEMGPGR